VITRYDEGGQVAAAEAKRVEVLCSTFGLDFRCSGNHARREASSRVERGGWAVQRIHECIVGCPCRFCPARNLGASCN